MKQAFLDEVADLFGGEPSLRQIDGMERILAATDGLPLKHRAYVLATAWHETGGRMEPVREAFGKTDQETIDRLQRAWDAGKLKWVKKPYWRRDKDGRAWFGRGYVQITFRENYRRLGKRLGVDLEMIPDLALQPDVAARILVVGMTEGLFTGRKMADFDNYTDMRRVVNGTDRAGLIAGYAKVFERALLAAADDDPAPEPAPKRTSLWSRFLDFLRRED